MSRLILALTFLLVVGSSAGADDFARGHDLFRQAAAARETEGEGSPSVRAGFRKAAEAWESLESEALTSTNLLTNIGNARAFAGDLGEAVLAYRRALVIDPENARARDALRSIRATLGIEDHEEEASTGLVRALFFWHDALSFGTRRALFGGLWIAGLALAVLAIRRRRLRIPAGLVVAAAVALFVSLTLTDAEGSGEAAAVLLVRSDGRTGDGTFYSVSHSAPLPAGAELTVLETRDGGWVHARLRDGTTTWLSTRSVARVLP